MIKKRWLPAIFCTLFLLGCAEINEEIVLNENGTGTYVTKTDLSQMIEMMQSFGGDEMNKEGLDKVIDTVLSMKSFADTSSNMSAEQKQLMSRGKMRLQMNMKEKIFKIDTDFPFSSYNDLQLLLAGAGGMSNLSGAMKKIFDKGATENTNLPDSPIDPGLDQISSIFDVVVKNGSISKKVNQEKFKVLMEKPEMAQMGQLTGAGIEILTSTVIKLPRPVINADNILLKLSDDKKTVTLKYNMLELFESPDKFSYTITY
ncbi:MAG: hypothetical protein ACKVOW_08080 [Chitinophagaceae bacterium]